MEELEEWGERYQEDVKDKGREEGSGNAEERENRHEILKQPKKQEGQKKREEEKK